MPVVQWQGTSDGKGKILSRIIPQNISCIERWKRDTEK